MKEIVIKKYNSTKNICTQVDDEDFEKLNHYRWHETLYGYVGRTVREADGKPRSVRMHRVVMGDPKGMVIDHKNRDRKDNRKENLRVCTHKENLRNVSKASSKSISKLRGAHKEGNKWVARIVLNGIISRLGRFATKEEAHIAYKDAAKKYHGEFSPW